MLASKAIFHHIWLKTLDGYAARLRLLLNSNKYSGGVPRSKLRSSKALYEAIRGYVKFMSSLSTSFLQKMSGKAKYLVVSTRLVIRKYQVLERVPNFHLGRCLSEVPVSFTNKLSNIFFVERWSVLSEIWKSNYSCIMPFRPSSYCYRDITRSIEISNVSVATSRLFYPKG